MKKVVVALYGIMTAAFLVASGVDLAFAQTPSMNNTTATTAPDDNDTTTETANQLQSSSNSTTAQPRIIQHSMGETEITGTPQRIVVLEWVYVEDLLALGVQPVGVADIQGMNKWVNMKELSLSPDVVDIGTRQEPNLEKILQLSPDLIITDRQRAEHIYNDLSAIAPTIVFNPYTAQEENIDHLTEMELTFMTIADIVDRHDAGLSVLQRMNTTFERAGQNISLVEGINNEFLVVQAYTGANDAAEMRIFTENSIPAQIMNRLGLKNAWDVEYEIYGYSTVGLEALIGVQHANFFYVVQDDDNVFANEWNNPVWQNLEFVKEGRAYPLGGDTWLFGGPISAEIFAEKVANALSGRGNNTAATAIVEMQSSSSPLAQ